MDISKPDRVHSISSGIPIYQYKVIKIYRYGCILNKYGNIPMIHIQDNHTSKEEEDENPLNKPRRNTRIHQRSQNLQPLRRITTVSTINYDCTISGGSNVEKPVPLASVYTTNPCDFP